MLRYLYASQLDAFPLLRDTMFRDRAHQFKTRLGWEVNVDDDGLERDEYDDMNPIYAIWERPDGTHGGSMRFMPTVERTMVNDHFQFLTDGVEIKSPLIWECTRFCLAPNADRRITAGLVIAADDLMRQFALTSFVGVFDPRMVRVYKTLGVALDLLGAKGEGTEEISVGLLHLKDTHRAKVLSRAGMTEQMSHEWFEASFNAPSNLSTKAVAFSLV